MSDTKLHLTRSRTRVGPGSPGRTSTAPQLPGALREWFGTLPPESVPYHAVRRFLIDLFEQEYLLWLMTETDGDWVRAASLADVEQKWLEFIAERYRVSLRLPARRASVGPCLEGA